MKWSQRNQKLIDIMFAVMLVTTKDKKFCKKTNDQKAEWLRQQLREFGFPTVPTAKSRGVLQ